MRRSGIVGVGQVPWGAHICVFYRDQIDLLDLVVPYIKAGLEDGEYCMWITAPPVAEHQANAALAAVLPNIEQYVMDGQLDLIPYTTWYLRQDQFDREQVIQQWVKKAEHAHRKGFEGIRITGNPIWLNTPEQWSEFGEYEREVHDTIKHERIIALCTYAAARCESEQMFEVLNRHTYTIRHTAKREWALVAIK